MKNKKVQILEFGFCWPLSVEFISVTVREREILTMITKSDTFSVIVQYCLKNKLSRVSKVCWGLLSHQIQMATEASFMKLS
jgi:hypothetical protein